MNLGTKIAKLRKENGLSQEQLGNIVKVTRQTISNWELGETYPNIEQLKMLSHVLNTSLDDLTDNKSTHSKDSKSKPSLKIFLIAIYFIVLASIIGFGIYWFTKKDFTNYYTGLVKCQVKNDWYDGMAYFEITEELDHTFTVTAFENSDLFYKKNTDNLADAYSILNDLKKATIANGGVCRPNNT